MELGWGPFGVVQAESGLCGGRSSKATVIRSLVSGRNGLAALRPWQEALGKGPGCPPVNTDSGSPATTGSQASSFPPPGDSYPQSCTHRGRSVCPSKDFRFSPPLGSGWFGCGTGLSGRKESHQSRFLVTTVWPTRGPSSPLGPPFAAAEAPSARVSESKQVGTEPHLTPAHCPSPSTSQLRRL